MKTKIIAAIAAAALAAGCASQAGSHAIASRASHSAGARASSTPPPPPPPATPDPKGTYQTSCDTIVPSGMSDPAYLTGEVDISNTGNVGIVAHVVFHWKQEGLPDVTLSRNVRVRWNGDKQVNFKYNAGSGLSTTPLDANMSWQENHGFKDPCKSHVSIISTFGTPQG